MTKKIVAISLALLMCVMCVTTASAASVPGEKVYIFENFEYTADNFKAGGNLAFGYDPALERYSQAVIPLDTINDLGNYWIGPSRQEEDRPDMKAYAKLEEGKGVNGTSAMGVYAAEPQPGGKANKINVQVYAGAPIDASDYYYVTFWADFTNINIRKMGVDFITADGAQSGTDELDETFLKYWFLAEGATEWTELTFDKDGSFGTASGDSVYGKKGWFSFSFDSFGAREKNAKTLDLGYYKGDEVPRDELISVALWYDFDYTLELNFADVPFYLDDITLSTSVVANNIELPGSEKSETENPPETPEDPTDPETPTQPSTSGTPSTSDSAEPADYTGLIIGIVAAVVVIGAVVVVIVIRKKKQ